LQQLAVKADVSAAAIHKIERNDMVPTITTLLKIATRTRPPVSYFIDNADAPPEPVAFTRAATRPAVFTPHAGLHLAGVSGPYTPFRSAAAVATLDRERTAAARTSSIQVKNSYSPWKGSVTFDIAGTSYKLGRGDALHFIGEQPHHWANEARLRRARCGCIARLLVAAPHLVRRATATRSHRVPVRRTDGFTMRCTRFR
jgi:transcriptional regulator with XRE-family HTH domain